MFIDKRIEGLLNYYGISYKEMGNDFVFRCPFHKEKIPSFFLDKEKGIFQCWGCGKKGNLVTFVKEIENVPAPSAFRRLLEFGIILEEKNSQVKDEWFESSDSSINKGSQKIRQIMKFARRDNAIQELLSSDYWGAMKFPPQIVSAFELGFIDDNVFIPIRDEKGTLVSFALRKTNEDSEKPKYYVCKGTRKKTIIYNLYRVQKETVVLAVEGYSDVWRAYQYGIKNCIAFLTCNVSDAQIQLLAKYFYNVVIAFDGDEAGKKGAEQFVSKVKNIMNVQKIELPLGKDVGSLSNDEFKKFIIKKGGIYA